VLSRGVETTFNGRPWWLSAEAMHHVRQRCTACTAKVWNFCRTITRSVATRCSLAPAGSVLTTLRMDFSHLFRAVRRGGCERCSRCRWRTKQQQLNPNPTHARTLTLGADHGHRIPTGYHPLFPHQLNPFTLGPIERPRSASLPEAALKTTQNSAGFGAYTSSSRPARRENSARGS
jgi:hypothetical protein